jgi:hypothetical protein
MSASFSIISHTPESRFEELKDLDLRLKKDF